MGTVYDKLMNCYKCLRSKTHLTYKKEEEKCTTNY